MVISGSWFWNSPIIRLIIASMKKGTPPTRTTPLVPFMKPCTASEALRRGGDHHAALRGELRAERRRLKRAPSLHEQGLADPGFKHGERTAHRRLGQAQHGGPLGDAAGIEHGGELHQMALVQPHTKMLY